MKKIVDRFFACSTISAFFASIIIAAITILTWRRFEFLATALYVSIFMLLWPYINKKKDES